MSPQNHVATNAQHTNGFKLHFDMNSLKCVIPTLHTSIYVCLAIWRQTKSKFPCKYNLKYLITSLYHLRGVYFTMWILTKLLRYIYICTISYASLVFANFSNTFLKNTFPVHIYVDLTLEGRCIITNVYCCMIVMVSVFVKTEPYHIMMENKTLHITCCIFNPYLRY